MIVLNLVQLALAALYSWVSLWSIGYHGAFLLLLGSLWFSGYNSCWDLYLCWSGAQTFVLDIANWVELGGGLLFNFTFGGEVLSLLLVAIMSCGSFVVLSFVYIEMWDDKEGPIFGILLIFFLVFMGILVFSGNFLLLYVGWEGIGLISLFLINFWSERARGVKAALKVFIINKLGDFLIFFAFCLLIAAGLGSEFIFLEAGGNFWAMHSAGWGFNLLDLGVFLLVVGGGVKSSQFGFHIWLLEAMEAPLGASALMHSSTLVVAGVVLSYKISGLIALSDITRSWIILWGCWTAVFASIIACFQYELKIVLAYSTISSMGFLYMLIGLGAYYEMLLYFVIHAFIKIYLFLVIGAIMFHCGGSQDFRWMGGLLYFIPLWWLMYVVGALGLGGLPYFSGYYCKSALWNYASNFNFYWGGVQVAILLGTICTYIYLFRLGYFIFIASRGGHRLVYRYRWPGLLTILTFGALLFLVAFGGNLWSIYLSYYWQLGGAGLYYFSSSIIEYSYIINSWGWLGLIFAYTTAYHIFFIIFIFFNSKLISKRWLIIFIIYLTSFIIWSL